LEPRLNSQNNLIIFEFNSLSGDIDSCLRLARRLTACDPDQVRTVAFINQVAAGPAAMLALSCQQVILQKDAKLGGPFEPPIDGEKLADLQLAVAGIAESLEKDAAALQAMLEPGLDVVRYRSRTTGQERLFTMEELFARPDADQWVSLGPQDFSTAIDANQAQQLEVARQIVSGWDELKSYFQLENDPESLKPTDLDRWLQQAALFLSSPFVAPWLLFLAMFFLFQELSQPGLGLPGFVGTVCLILYFWSQHLGGNATWLEIMLFVAGVAFLLIELLLLPGFGIFGFGGLGMIVASIVLASQSFIFPRTSEEMAQLPRTLFALAGTAGGIIVALVALRSVLPKMPYFKRMMLEPPTRSEEDVMQGRDPEAMVNWNHLLGQRGTAITNLIPAGKAKIDGQLIDVISDGRLIEKGQSIEVVQVAGNKVVVNPIES
jgi:membrane-bound ClpP family serine protease